VKPSVSDARGRESARGDGALDGGAPERGARRGGTGRGLPALAAAAALLLMGVARADQLRPFEATYAWIWHGMTVAVTTVKLEKTGDTWTYASTSEPRGIGKLLSQRPRTTSVLKVTDAGVQPLSYRGDDGTSSSKRTVNVQYDWAHEKATGVYEETPVDLHLTSGVQDDSSVQVALMVELLRGRTPEHFLLLDKNSVREYRYKREGEETLATPVGAVATVIYSSQRANSPHVNRYWCAPDRGYVPMRVEQKRGDEVQWTMEIRAFRRE
jgi:Protein of unknown function (DUF3108)